MEIGTDFALTWVGVEADRTPDFDAARAAVNEEMLSDLDPDLREDTWGVDATDEEVLAAMRAQIDELERLWVGTNREVVRVEVRGADFLFTGGMSWGDGPTDAYDVVERVLAIPGALEAAGFTE